MPTPLGTAAPARIGAAYASSVPIEAPPPGGVEFPEGLRWWLQHTVDAHAGATVVELRLKGCTLHRPRIPAAGPVQTMQVSTLRSVPSARATAWAPYLSTPLADEMADVVICSQVFHAIASQDTLTEISRVLKLRGRLALLWHVPDIQVPWVARMAEILERYGAAPPCHRDWKWPEEFPHPAFGRLDRWRAGNARFGPAQDVIVNPMMATPFARPLYAKERCTLELELQRVISGEPELQRPIVAMPYRTLAYSCVRVL